MTALAPQRATPPRPPDGGLPARRAVIRWAWRLFRRERRQQALILALLTLALAATTVGLGLAGNVAARADSIFGTATAKITLPGSDRSLTADIARLKSRFGTIEVVEREQVPIPGSVSTVDLRAQDPHGPYLSSTLHLDAGHYPSGPDQVAVTHRVASIFDLHLDGTWQLNGRRLDVVGIVEDPANLLDAFALMAPGQLPAPTSVDVLVDAPPSQLHFLGLSSGPAVNLSTKGSSGAQSAALAVLVLATIGLVFVGLMAVGGFAVLAARRQRALGMLGAMGATDRHVRLAMLANGAAVGAAGAVVGTAVGLAGWLAFAPRLETLVGHRIDRYTLPWWAIAAAMLLATVTAVVAAWWPARTTARLPIVAALSGRPPRPQPAHRFALLGGLLLVAGLGSLVVSRQQRPPLIVAGIVATTFGVLFLAPLAIGGLAALSGRAPIAVRLALRDLARYRARSGAALGAISLAIGIAATIAISAAASAATQTDQSSGNLPANQLLVKVSSDSGPVPILSAGQVQQAQAQVGAIAAGVGSRDILALEQAVDTTVSSITDPVTGVSGKPAAAMATATARKNGTSFNIGGPLYVATPEVLAQYGIAAADVDPTADILTSRTDLGTQKLLVFKGPRSGIDPKIQQLPLPTYTADPNTLITEHAVQAYGLTATPTAWLVQAPTALTTKQVDAADKLAAGAGLVIETRALQADTARVRLYATGVGMLVALGILAMTIGLIRSETAADLRTLSAAGASPRTRRAITGATAGGLAFLGGVLGAGGAYAAMLAWQHAKLSVLGHVPVVEIAVIVFGLPTLAMVGGWLLAGREPAGMARQPLE